MKYPPIGKAPRRFPSCLARGILGGEGLPSFLRGARSSQAGRHQTTDPAVDFVNGLEAENMMGLATFPEAFCHWQWRLGRYPSVPPEFPD